VWAAGCGFAGAELGKEVPVVLKTWSALHDVVCDLTLTPRDYRATDRGMIVNKARL